MKALRHIGLAQLGVEEVFRQHANVYMSGMDNVFNKEQKKYVHVVFNKGAHESVGGQ